MASQLTAEQIRAYIEAQLVTMDTLAAQAEADLRTLRATFAEEILNSPTLELTPERRHAYRQLQAVCVDQLNIIIGGRQAYTDALTAIQEAPDGVDNPGSMDG